MEYYTLEILYNPESKVLENIKTRSIEELLQVLLENKTLFKEGLCKWIYKLYDNYIISYEERILLQKYLSENRPGRCFNLGGTYKGFFWKPHNINPRIKWIKKHIARN